MWEESFHHHADSVIGTYLLALQSCESRRPLLTLQPLQNEVGGGNEK